MWFARRHGAHVVLKIGDADARNREAATLRLYDRGGAPSCRLLEADADAIVVERVIPGDDLRPLVGTDDDSATAVIGALISQLQAAAAVTHQPPELPALAQVATVFDRLPGHGPAPVPASLLDSARELTHELSSPTARDSVLHGDLHHQNVLRSGWDPQDCDWVAIDPHGWWGDRAFDCVPMLLDLHDPQALRGLTDVQVRQRALRRIAILAEQTELDSDRIRAWAIAGAVISELWCWEDHGLVQYWPQRLAQVLSEA